ncbi:MAG: hypothetical protein M3Q56_13380 [Bacteroidota bacterium]|nr:hypothetical protein [Bacteroidota bacterium]
MGCTSCSTGKNGKPGGCGNKGHCESGGCNKLNTFDWLTALDIDDPSSYLFAEVSFKNGARKSFFKIPDHYNFTTGDIVVVDAGNGGYDLGRVSLMGDLVKIQMKRKNFSEDRISFDIIRKANPRDIEKLDEARRMEQPALVKARVISRSLGLDMKIGDVEYQADLKKATFFYTSDGWVDFRELVRSYAKEFKVKIEMRQIGARQESARIGGIGSCGRELCCSTWLTDFKSVNTTAARYQNIAINQSKLSGQCGRLKCCLNYELDMYVDELDKYPSNVEVLRAKQGVASLVKIDIFKGLLYYQYEPERGRSVVMPLMPEEVRRIKALNEKGEMPLEIVAAIESQPEVKKEDAYVDVTGFIELPTEKKKKKKKNKYNKERNFENRPRISNENSSIEPSPEQKNPRDPKNNPPQGQKPFYQKPKHQRPYNRPNDRPNDKSPDKENKE